MVKLNEIDKDTRLAWEEFQHKTYDTTRERNEEDHSRVLRYVATGNAGGIVVVLTAIGSLWQTGQPTSVLTGPLAIFLIGVFCAGASSFILLARSNAAMDAFLKWHTDTVENRIDAAGAYPIPSTDARQRRFNVFFQRLSGILFVFGSMTGLIMLSRLP